MILQRVGINDTQQSIDTAQKSINEARINYNSHEKSKTFLDLMLVDRCFKGAI